VGTSIPIAAAIRSFWQHPLRNETYAWAADNRLYVLSGDGSTVIQSSPVLTGGTTLFKNDGSKMYVFHNTNKSLREYSLSDFSLVRTLQLPDSISPYTTCVLGNNGNFYVGNYEGKVWTYNESTGSVLSSTRFFQYIGSNPTMAASHDGKYLFLADDGSLYKLNIQTDTPSLEKKTTVSFGSNISVISVSQDQQNLFVICSGTVYILKISDMSTAAVLSLSHPPCNSRNSSLPTSAANVLQDGTSFFVISAGRFIEQFDLSSYQQVKSWCMVNYPQCIGVSRNGQFLLMGDMKTPIPNLLLTR
jgi:hypothetical protein